MAAYHFSDARVGVRSCGDAPMCFTRYPRERGRGHVDMLCAVGRQSPIHFRWRPVLLDAEDEFILELAVAGQCEFIVTHNKKDFEGVEQFGIRAVADHLAGRDYLRTRGTRSSRERFLAALNEIPEVEPDEHDRL